MTLRGDYDSPQEPFFIFCDGSLVTASQATLVLKSALADLGLDSSLY